MVVFVVIMGDFVVIIFFLVVISAIFVVNLIKFVVIPTSHQKPSAHPNSKRGKYKKNAL